LWSQGGENYDLEETLSLSFGFPALIALHFGKMKFSIMRQVYSKENIKRFIGELLTGKAKLNNIPSVLPKIKNTKEYISTEL
jgi:protein disulfide-isomerase A6